MPRISHLALVAGNCLGMCETPANDVLAAFGLELPPVDQSTDVEPNQVPTDEFEQPAMKHLSAQLGDFVGHFDFVGHAPSHREPSGKRVRQGRFRCIRCGDTRVGKLRHFRVRKLHCKNCDRTNKPLVVGERSGHFEYLGRAVAARKNGNYQIRIRCTRCGKERQSVSSRFRQGYSCRRCDLPAMRPSMAKMIGASIGGFVCDSIHREKGKTPRVAAMCSGCGDKRFVTIDGYRQGLRCERCELGGGVRKDFTGQRVGPYLCTGRTYGTTDRSGNRTLRWVMTCQDCGDVRHVRRNQIEQGLSCKVCDNN